MTNGSRIRQMNDEELAEFLARITMPDEDTIVIDGNEFWDESEIAGWLKEDA